MNKRMKKILTTVLAGGVAVFGATAVACGKEETPEVGVYYYCDAEGREYIITLNSGEKFTFLVKGENEAGEYELEGESLTLTFEDDEIVANLKDGVLTLTYENSEMRFLRKTNYTVTFDSAGGSAVDSVSVVNGKTVGKPADPTRANYVFMGWYADSELTTPFQFDGTPVTSDVTIYARWVEKMPGQTEYSVNYDFNYEGANEPEYVTTIGGKIYDVPTPAREGYTFGGWWISMYEDASKFSYPYVDGMVFGEDTSLYAAWTVATADKLASPAVAVSASAVSWNAVKGATAYRLEVSGPNGFATINEDVTGTTKAIDFANAPAGDYVVKVTAVANDETKNSVETVRYYKNKALKRVSNFTVAEPALLVFGAVENAQKYYVTVDCGDENHYHVNYDNGNSTNFNFANCAMQEGGIVFTVTAVADGYAPSVSQKFVYDRTLGEVSQLVFDEASETLNWTAVNGASNYVVKVSYDNDTVTYNNGTATNFSLKGFDAKKLTVSVAAQTKGYNVGKAATYEYDKKTLAAPSNVRILDTTLTWAEVAGATSYEIKIGNVQKTSTTASFDFSTLEWSEVKDYKLSVKAKGATDSLWSDEIDVRYMEMYESLSYVGGTVSWRHVIGAEKYEVFVNNVLKATVENGDNFANVKFTKAGWNTIAVRAYFDGIESVAVGINVYAYTLEFDAREGTPVNDQFYARGDVLDLPETTREGYEFGGWYNIPSGAEGNGACYDVEAYDFGGDAMLFAYWKPKTYNVSLNMSGKETVAGDDEAQVQYGRAFEIAPPEAMDTKYVFAGWFSQPDCSEASRLTNEFGESTKVWAYAVEGKEIYAGWKQPLEFKQKSDGTYSVKKGVDYSFFPEITIPAYYNGVPVTEIASYAFQHITSIEVINIPDTIEYVDVIGNAFISMSKLRAINVYHVEDNYEEPKYWSSDGLLMENDHLTGGVNLVYVPLAKAGRCVVPEGVTTISSRAFQYSKVTEVVFPTTLKTVLKEAFNAARQLKKISFADPTSTAGASYLYIYERAFKDCTALTDVYLPARVQEFGMDDVDETIFHGIRESFYGCTALNNVFVAEGSTLFASVDGMLTNADKTQILYCPVSRTGVLTIPNGIKTVGERTFENCKRLTEIVIPGFVEEIGDYAFANCDKATKVTFKKAVGSRTLTVGNAVFYSCNNLTDVVYEDGSKVVSLGAYAFAECTRLAKIEVPVTMTSVGEAAFSGCRGAKTVEIKDGDNELVFGEMVFQNCTGLQEITIPVRVKTLPGSAFPGCDNLQTVNVATGSESFVAENGVLFNKDKTNLIFYPKGTLITEYVVPETVKYIGASVFENNPRLTKVTLGANVVEIGAYAFANCLNLKVVQMNGGTEALVIGEYAFANCTNLGEDVEVEGTATANPIAIPARESVVVGAYAFYNDVNVKTVTLPDSVVSIGASAFENTRITGVNMTNNLTVIGDRAFAKTNMANSAITIPASVVSLGEFVFAESNLANLTIAKGVKAIGKNFARDTKITSITIPNSVEVIGSGAFYNVSTLTNVVFEDGDKDLVLGTYVDDTADYNIASTSTGRCMYEGYVFYGTKLGYSADGNFKIALPDRLTIIGAYSFMSITTLDVTMNTTSRLQNVGLSAFKGCTSLTSFYFSKYLRDFAATGDKITSKETMNGIARIAFDGCTNLATVTFGLEANDSRFSIGHQAFMNCAFTEIVLPARLTNPVPYLSSDDYDTYGFCLSAFDKSTSAKKSGSNLASIKIDRTNNNASPIIEKDGAIYTADGKTLFYVPAKLKGSIEIPNTVTYVHYAAAQGCTLLENVTFEDGGSEDLVFGEEAFNGCTKLGKVTTVDPETEATSTEYVTISFPERTTEIGWNSFKSCSSIKTIDLPDSLVKIGQAAFESTGLTSVKIPVGVKEIVATAFQKCTSLATIDFSESTLEKLGRKTFNGCTALTEVELPSALETITGNSEEGVFNGCTLNRLVVPDNLGDVASLLAGCNCTNVIINKTNMKFKMETEGVNANVIFSKDGTILAQYPASSTATEYVIPDGVTTISAKTFMSNTTITKIVIPNTVTEISAQAFKGCTNLTTVEFKTGGTANLTIGAEAFYECSKLNNVIIPARTVTIGNYAFYSCAALTNLSFESGGRLETIGNYAFTGTQGRTFGGQTMPGTYPTFTSLVLPSTLKTIGGWAFEYNDKLTSVTFEGNKSSLQKIGGSAFYICSNLTTFTIPSTLTSIGDLAFYRSGITEAILPEGMATVGTAFKECANLKTVVIPSTVTAMSSEAFSKCTSLESVYIAGNLKNIPSKAFYNCTSLKTLTLEEGIETIGSEAFYGCANLESLELPATIRNVYNDDGVTGKIGIGDNAFYNCEKLETLLIKSSEPVTIGAYAFYNCKKVDSIVLPTSLEMFGDAKAIGDYAFYGCENAIGSLEIPGGATVVGAYAFYNGKKFTSIYVNYGVAEIGDFAFGGAVQAKVIDLPETVTTLGANPFVDCTGVQTFNIADTNSDLIFEGGVLYNSTKTQLIMAPVSMAGEVVLPETVTEIAGGAFANCVGLTGITLSANITEIGANTFKNTGLTSIKIPKNINLIGDSAFQGCTALQTVTFEAGGVQNMTIGAYAFDGCTALTAIEIPFRVRSTAEVQGIGDYAFNNCSSLTSFTFEATGVASDSSAKLSFGAYALAGTAQLSSVTLPSYAGTVKSGSSTKFALFGKYAFAGSGITAMEIPSEVTSIPEGLFKNCTSLVSVNLKGSVATFNASCFEGCTALTTLTFTTAGKNAITTIKDYAFKGCTSLASFRICNGLTTMGKEVFSGWTADQTIAFATTGIGTSWTWDSTWNKDCSATITYGTETPSGDGSGGGSGGLTPGKPIIPGVRPRL